jgi:subtilisin-like proprotein convertase family protein
MRRTSHALAVLLFSLGLWHQHAFAQVYRVAAPSLVPDAGTRLSTISVPNTSTITGLRVVVSIQHGCDSDLDLILIHNDTYVRLSSANGGLEQDYLSTRFSDSAPSGIYDAQAPFVGTFRPEGGVLVPFVGSALPPNAAPNLSALVGQSMAGDWTLRVDDTAAGYSGVLSYWSLEFNGAVDPNGPALAVGPPPPDVWIERTDAGELTGTAQRCVGTGPLTQIVGSLGAGDTDMYTIDICNPGVFSATTIGGAYFDTCLYLFDSQGYGVAFNDEESGPTSQSVITSAYIAAPGTYHLAITAHGRKPLDRLGHPIWQDEPAVAERRPDGPGYQHRLAGWTGTPDGGFYRIMLSGACYSSTPCAAADFNGDGFAGTDQDIQDFFACMAGNCCPTCGSTDIDGDGIPNTDADVVAFFAALTGGC